MPAAKTLQHSYAAAATRIPLGKKAFAAYTRGLDEAAFHDAT